MKKKSALNIDGEVFYAEQLGALVGTPLCHRVIKAVGPFVREVIERKERLKGGGEAELAALVIRGLEMLPEQLVTELAEKFSESCTVVFNGAPMPLGGQGGIFDQYFAGRYPHLMKWLYEMARFNFGNFLGSSATASPSTGPAAAPTS